MATKATILKALIKAADDAREKIEDATELDKIIELAQDFCNNEANDAATELRALGEDKSEKTQDAYETLADEWEAWANAIEAHLDEFEYDEDDKENEEDEQLRMHIEEVHGNVMYELENCPHGD